MITKDFEKFKSIFSFNEESKLVPVECLKLLYNIGFKLVPCNSNGIPNVKDLVTEEEFKQYPQAMGKPVRVIYLNPDFWTLERIEKEKWRFECVKTTFGNTYIRDIQGNKISNSNSKLLQLHGLDIDSEAAYHKVKSDLENDYILYTFVTKSPTEFHYHIYWFEEISEGEDKEENDHVPISTVDCKSQDQALEIRTGLNRVEYLTLPPSLGYEIEGCTKLNAPEIMIRNGLYDKFVNETFKDLLQSEEIKKHRKKPTNINGNGSNLHQVHDFRPKLSEIQISLVSKWLKQFYKPHKRYHLMFAFVGTMYHNLVHSESIHQIVDSICSLVSDLSSENKSKWHGMINSTYAEGDAGGSIYGYPTLKKAIQSNIACEESDADKCIEDIKNNQAQDNSDKQQAFDYSTLQVISISEAARMHSGHCKVEKDSNELVINSRFVSCEHYTGKSLSVIISPEEDGSYALRTGPIITCKGAILALDELGHMKLEDQGNLSMTMQMQHIPFGSYGITGDIDAQTLIIASCNPLSGKWKDPKPLIPVIRELFLFDSYP